MRTADPAAALSAAAAPGALATSTAAVPLGWDERPAGWRPRKGDRVTVTRLIRRGGLGGDGRDPRLCVGRSGTIVADDAE
eukprot:634812-Prymnesium_polylepis.1